MSPSLGKALTVCLVVPAAGAGSAQAALYSQNFDVDDTANWNVNSGPGTNAANLFFDYSTVGIPPAPNSTGGSTRGVKLQGNLSGNRAGAISVSPQGQSFTGDYRMDFDFWYNFNGPAPAGGNGSTQVGGAGVGTAGNIPQWLGGTKDSIFFVVSGGGGSTEDYRVYSPSSFSSGYAPSTGVFAAGSATSAQNSSDPYYADFAGMSPPAAQTALFAQQTGTAQTGTLAFAWHRGSIIHSAGNVTFSIDGKLIATVNGADDNVVGTNILLTHFDIDLASSTDPNAGALLFSLFDNIQVTQIPEPASMALGILGLCGSGLRRRRA